MANDNLEASRLCVEAVGDFFMPMSSSASSGEGVIASPVTSVRRWNVFCRSLDNQLHAKEGETGSPTSLHCLQPNGLHCLVECMNHGWGDISSKGDFAV